MKKKINFSWINNGFSVRARLNIFAVLLSLVFVVLGYFFYYTYNEVNNANTYQTRLANLLDATDFMAVNQARFLNYMQYSDDATLIAENEYLKQFNENYNLARDILFSFVGNDDFLELVDKEQIDSLLQQTEQYKIISDSLVSQIEARGNQNIGLIGEINRLGNQLMRLYVFEENPALKAQMSVIRQLEKNYLLNADITFQSEMQYALQSLVELLEAIPEDEFTEQYELIDDLADYESVMQEIVVMDGIIGFRDKAGLIQQQQMHFSVLHNLMNDVLANFRFEEEQRLTGVLNLFYLLMAIAIIIMFIALFILVRIIRKPIGILNETFDILALGKIPHDIPKVKQKTEFKTLLVKLLTVINGLRSNIDFAKAIEHGKYDTEYSLLSDEDELGNALLEMRESLVVAEKETQKSREEEKQQSWINAGTAKFAEILNQNYNTTEDFAYSIISNLVKYLNANQGGFFILNDDSENEKFLELKSAFAYDRRKFLEKRVQIGEGYVGTCVLEKNMIYRTELPEDYITITSGLGDAPPTVLLILPLLMEDDVYGVMEIAAFTPFEDYQLDFIKKVSETIASTISSVKSREKTEQLLKKSQEQSEQIIQTEEEMRQNLEEMEATQEEATRREQLLREKLEEANLMIAELEKKLKQ